MISLLLATLALPAHASVMVSRAAVQADNALRVDVTVRTTESSRIELRIWRTGEARTTGWSTPVSDAASSNHVVTLWGLEPDTSYSYDVLVRPEGAPVYRYGRRLSFTTGSVPSEFTTMAIGAGTGSPDFEWLMLDTVTLDDGTGALLMVTPEAVVQWYQKVPDTGTGLAAQAWDEVNHRVYAVASNGHVMGWELDGTVTVDWEVGAELPVQPHHEIAVVGEELYMLVSRARTIDGFDVVEDGILGMAMDGTVVFEWWLSEDGGLNPLDNAPPRWPMPGVGYWRTVFPTSRDWLHANSLQIREEDGLRVAYVSMREVSQVLRLEMDTNTVSWLAGANASRSTDSLGDFSLDAATGDLRWWALQHHAHIEEDGLLYMFDNGQAGIRSRAIAVSMDDATGVATIERQADFTELLDGDFTGMCDSRGSAFRTDADHIVATCGPAGLVADFDAADALTWSLWLLDSNALYRSTPIADVPR